MATAKRRRETEMVGRTMSARLATFLWLLFCIVGEVRKLSLAYPLALGGARKGSGRSIAVTTATTTSISPFMPLSSPPASNTKMCVFPGPFPRSHPASDHWRAGCEQPRPRVQCPHRPGCHRWLFQAMCGSRRQRGLQGHQSIGTLYHLCCGTRGADRCSRGGFSSSRACVLSAST